MTRNEKETAVHNLNERFARATVTLVASSKGLSVAKMQQLRRAIKQAGGEYKVAKNTLARRAVPATAFAHLEALLTGPTGLIFGYADPVAVTKALVRFAEENDKLSIAAAVIDNRVLDRAAVTDLSRLPGKSVLQSMLLALMQAPASQLVRTLQEPAARIVRVLNGVRERLEETA